MDLDEYQKAVAPRKVEVGFSYFWVRTADGRRTWCSRNRQEVEAKCDVSYGETVEPRNCPYSGCYLGPDALPPCPLCYE